MTETIVGKKKTKTSKAIFIPEFIPLQKIVS